MPTDPPELVFVVADERAGADEDLPEPAGAPWWLRARVPLGVATAVLLLAAVLYRISSSGPDAHRPAPAAGPDRPTVTDSADRPQFPVDGGGITVQLPAGRRHWTIRIGPGQIGEDPACDILPKCIVTDGAPDSVVHALRDYLPGLRVAFASTSLERTGIAGQDHRFRAMTLVARRGRATIRIVESRTGRHDDRPARANERESALGTEIYARAFVDGYSIWIDLTAPTGHVPVQVRDILKLASDARLRPSD